MLDRVPPAGVSRRALLRSALAAGVAAGTAGIPAASATRFPERGLARPKVARLGDSIVQFAEYARIDGPARLSRRARGAMTWVKTLFPAFNDDTWHHPEDLRQGRCMRGSNNGVAGDHLGYLTPQNPGTLRRWDQEVAPMGPQVVLLSVGTNDLNSFLPAAMVRAGLRRQIAAITAAGAIPIVTTVRPRGALGRAAWAMPDQSSDSRYAARREVNDWLRSQGSGRVLVADVNAYLEDSRSRAGAGGGWLPDLTPVDGVHPGAPAAWAEALALLPILRTLVADDNVYGDDPLAPENLLPNGAFTGTSGLIGWGVEGHCASGWAITRRSGDARMRASTTVEDGVAKQVLEITPGHHDTTFILRTDPALLPLTGLDDAWLRFHLSQEVSAHPGWLSYNPRLLFSAGGQNWTLLAGALETGPGELLPSAAWSGWPATHPVRRRPGDVAASCSVAITVAGGVPGTPVLRFSRAQLRQVPDPRPAWNVTASGASHQAEPFLPSPATGPPASGASLSSRSSSAGPGEPGSALRSWPSGW